MYGQLWHRLRSLWANEPARVGRTRGARVVGAGSTTRKKATEMNMPGFTAEASLHGKDRYFYTLRTFGSANETILLAQRPGGCAECIKECAQIRKEQKERHRESLRIYHEFGGPLPLFRPSPVDCGRLCNCECYGICPPPQPPPRPQPSLPPPSGTGPGGGEPPIPLPEPGCYFVSTECRVIYQTCKYCCYDGRSYTRGCGGPWGDGIFGCGGWYDALPCWRGSGP